MLRATCSADVHRCRPDSNNTKDTRVFAGSRRTTLPVSRKTCVLVKNCHPRVTFDAPKPDTRNSVQQRRRKTQSTWNTPETRHSSGSQQKTCWSSESKSRFADERRVYMSCMLQNFSSIFDRDSSCNRVSNATNSVDGLISSKSSWLNKGAPLAFWRLPDSKVGSKVHLQRFLTKNDSITARSGYPVLVRLSASIVEVLTKCMRPSQHEQDIQF